MSISGVSSGSNNYWQQMQSSSQTDPAAMAQALANQMMQTMDTNGDGQLSASEAGVSQSTLSLADTNGNGTLSESELINLISQNSPFMGGMYMPQSTDSTSASSSGTAPDSTQLFNTLDTNGDGTLTQAEFVAGRPNGVSETQADDMWSKLDPQGTGSLSQSQFQTAMQNMAPSSLAADGQAGDLSASNSTSATGGATGMHHHHHHHMMSGGATGQSGDSSASDTTSDTSNDIFAALTGASSAAGTTTTTGTTAATGTDSNSGSTSTTNATGSANATGATATTATGQSLSNLLAALLANYGQSRYQESMNSNLAGLLNSNQSLNYGGISVTA